MHNINTHVYASCFYIEHAAYLVLPDYGILCQSFHFCLVTYSWLMRALHRGCGYAGLAVTIVSGPLTHSHCNTQPSHSVYYAA